MRRQLCLLLALGIATDAKNDEIDELRSTLNALKTELAALNAWKQQVSPQLRVQAEISSAQSPGSSPPKRRLSGSSNNAASLTYDGTELTIGSSVTVTGNFSVTGSTPGNCFTRWGASGCGSSAYTAVVSGFPGGFELSMSGGQQASDPVCISASAAVVGAQWTTGSLQRLMRGAPDDDGIGFTEIEGHCTECCTGGCYVAWGGVQCASGYSPVYRGRAGGLEAYNTGRLYSKQMCVDDSDDSVTTNSANEQTYYTRFFRHTADGQGMDVVTGECRMCCK